MYSTAIYEMIEFYFSTGSADRTINLAITFWHTRYPSRTSGRFGQNCKGTECKSAGKILASYDITEAKRLKHSTCFAEIYMHSSFTPPLLQNRHFTVKATAMSSLLVI